MVDDSCLGFEVVGNTVRRLKHLSWWVFEVAVFRSVGHAR